MDFALFGVGMSAVEEGGMAEGADGGGTGFFGDPLGELSLFLFECGEFYFEQFVVIEELFEFGEERLVEAFFADVDGGPESLSEAAEIGFLEAFHRCSRQRRRTCRGRRELNLNVIGGSFRSLKVAGRAVIVGVDSTSTNQPKKESP